MLANCPISSSIVPNLAKDGFFVHGIAYTGMIQDIFPHHFSNEYQPQTAVQPEHLVLHYKDDTLLLKRTGDIFTVPQFRDLPPLPEHSECRWIGQLNHTPCFLVLGDISTDHPSLIYEDIRFFRTTQQKEIAWLCLVGLHLSNWYKQHAYCGQCGSPTRQKADERALECPNCHLVVYPKIAPAIIVAIRSTNKLLLARNANFPDGWFSLVAGYADIGESLEETVRREVKEEVGLDICGIRYYKSQPWPLSGSLMVGFTAEGNEEQPLHLDGVEITEAGWYDRNNLPNHPPALSIAGEMIEKFKQGIL